MWIIDYAQSNPNKGVTVVGDSVPHLNLGAKRDFKNIMIANGYWDSACWAESGVYTFETGTIVEFISFDKFGKAHGPRRDVLFLNEANYLPFNIVDQLITRTRKVVWMDWNPSSEFYFYTDMLGQRDDIDFMGDRGNFPPLTYKDNEALDQDSVKEIEAHKNPAWRKVYIDGLLGEIEGRIYTNWQIIDAVPHEARLERYGVDFGWHPDPCAIVAVYYYNGGYILDEVAFQLEMPNREIAETLKNLPKAPVIADSAEPKSIAEIKMYGVNIVPTLKGADSVRHGIKAVQDQKISVTKASANLLKEYRNYLWETDRDGNILPGTPVDSNNHTLDALRYAVNSLVPVIRRRELVGDIVRSTNRQRTQMAL